VNGATRFCGGERARRRRRAVGNGGRLRWLGAARGEGERGKWRGAEREARRGFHLELSTRRGGLGFSCAPRGEKLLLRSAMTVTDRFLKMAIQSSIDPTDSEYSSCQHG